MSGYTQLTHGQRYQIEALLKTGHDQTMIANVLSVHKSTISREIACNGGRRHYRAIQADEDAWERSRIVWRPGSGSLKRRIVGTRVPGRPWIPCEDYRY